MKPHRSYEERHAVIINLLFVLLFLVSTTTVQSQTPTNFSGKWEFDTTRSSSGMLETTYGGTVILQINQNPSSISFSEIWKKKGNSDYKTSADAYNLDGKEKIRKSDIGTSKKSAKWSQDKKILTITNLDTQKLKGVLQDFLVVDTYTLSDGGRTLTMERSSKNPVQGEKTAKKVYSKI